MTAMAHRMAGHEPHARRSFLSDFILGSQDGLVNVLGILLGITAATSNLRLVLVATLAALGAESISMGAVAYTSTLARRLVYRSEEEREKQEMVEVPDLERQEVRTVLEEWGYSGEQLESLVRQLSDNPRAWLKFMMAFELRLQPVDEREPLNSGFVVGLATVAGSAVPLVSLLAFPHDLRAAVVASVVVCGAVLFTIGWYEARITGGGYWRHGLQMLVIGLGSGFAGYLIGHFLGATPGL